MVDTDYQPYIDGLNADLYVKDIKGGYYLGQVWPGPTNFPDFFHPASQVIYMYIYTYIYILFDIYYVCIINLYIGLLDQAIEDIP